MVSSLDLWHRYRTSNFLKYLHPLLILAATGIAWAGDWYPVEVDVWEPPFNTEHQLVQKSCTPLNEADKRWNICVSIPHMKTAMANCREEATSTGLRDEADITTYIDLCMQAWQSLSENTESYSTSEETGDTPVETPESMAQ